MQFRLISAPEWLRPLIDLDHEAMLWLNSLHADWMDPVQWLFSQTYTWIPLFVFIVHRLWKQSGWKKMLLVLASIGLIVAAADLSSVRLFKYQFKRPRPSHHEVIGPQMHHVTNFKGQVYEGGAYGFVSSHAANFVGIATFLFYVFGGRRKRSNWLLFLWAGIICYSRIYLGVHYPADIIGGSALGFLIGWMIYRSFYGYLHDKFIVA